MGQEPIERAERVKEALLNGILRGGPAKASVIASGLMGSISGSAIAARISLRPSNPSLDPSHIRRRPPGRSFVAYIATASRVRRCAGTASLLAQPRSSRNMAASWR